MNFAVIDAELVVKLLLLLLIGMGPKVALVPFLAKTKHLDVETQRAVGRRMVVTAVVTAIVLFATGWLLLRLLHISGGAVAVGGAIVLAILAVNMAAVDKEGRGSGRDPRGSGADRGLPAGGALFAEPGRHHDPHHCVRRDRLGRERRLGPGARPAGGRSHYLVFANIDTLSKRLNPVGLVISEVVFGILLTAVAVQLMVYGLGALGIISVATH